MVDEDRLGRVARVALRHALERERAGLDQEVVHAELRGVAALAVARGVGELGVDSLAEEEERRGVDVDAQIEMRDGLLGLREAPRDRLSHHRERAHLGIGEPDARGLQRGVGADHLSARAALGGRGRAGRGLAVRRRRFAETLEIAGDDASAGAAPVRAAEIDAPLARDAAHVRRGEHAPVPIG